MIRSYRRAADVEDLKAMTQGKGRGARLSRLLGDEEGA
jgi:hypothetical protein